MRKDFDDSKPRLSRGLRIQAELWIMRSGVSRARAQYRGGLQ